MKLSKSKLKQIIKEELDNIKEVDDDWYSDEHETLADKMFADDEGPRYPQYPGDSINARVLWDDLTYLLHQWDGSHSYHDDLVKVMQSFHPEELGEGKPDKGQKKSTKEWGKEARKRDDKSRAQGKKATREREKEERGKRSEAKLEE